LATKTWLTARRLKRIGDQRVERIRGDGNDFPPPDRGSSALDGFGLGLIWINLNKIGGQL